MGSPRLAIIFASDEQVLLCKVPMKTIVGLTSSRRRANRSVLVPDTPAELWSFSETPVPESSWLSAPLDSQPLSAPSCLPPSPTHSSTCPDLPLNKQHIIYTTYNKITSKKRAARLTRKRTKRSKNNMLSLRYIHSYDNRWLHLSLHK